MEEKKFTVRPVIDLPKPDRSAETEQDHQSLKTKLKESLVKLKSCSTTTVEKALDAIYHAESVWFLIFAIGIRDIQFTPEEKTELGPLIKSSLTALGRELDARIWKFAAALAEESLIVRSAVEFLATNYRDFADGRDGFLSERLDEFIEIEPVDDLTELLEIWKDSPWDFFDFTGPVPEGVPEEHHWWYRLEEQNAIMFCSGD